MPKSFDITGHTMAERTRAEADAFADLQLLSRLVTDMPEPAESHTLYECLMDVAIEIMHSDYASLQILFPGLQATANEGELRLLAFRGFEPEAEKFWETVRGDAVSPCGQALRTRVRCMVPDVELCRFMEGSEDLAVCRRMGIRAVQSTPLFSRHGELLGMVSTHWKRPRQPNGRDFRMFDILARHAANLVDCQQTEEALLDSEARQRSQAEAFKAAVTGASLAESLDILLRNAVAQIPGDPRAAFYLADDEGARLHPVPAASGMSESYTSQVDGFEIGPHSLSCGLATHTGHPIITADVFEDPQWMPMRGLARDYDFRGCWSFPIHTTGGRAIGTFALYHRHRREASRHDMTVAEATTQAAAIIISRHQETEKRRLSEQAARDADRHKDEFLATLAHELRNPLTPLRNGLEVMRQDNPEATEKARALMTRQLAQLTRLVDDLLDVSRISRGHIQLHLAHTELTTVVRDAVESTYARVSAARHILRVNLPAESVNLRADPDRLAQVLVNLINNASKYTSAKGRIEISLVHEDDTAIISVRDTGMGISADRLAKIFDMFEQADQPDGQWNEGLGIGLTLARQIVELHGGTVEARSAGAGRGAEFIVRLPLTADEPPETAEAEPSAAESRPLRLLVVDDDHAVSDSMSLMLGSWGHETRVAYSGAEALEVAAAFRPHAIFLDIGLPGMDGFETARRLRATPDGRDVLLVALTGWSQEEARARTADAGFNRHLVKPVDPNILERLLAELADY